MSAAVHEERAADHEAHLLLQRPLEQFPIVDALGQFNPQEEPAAWRGPLDAARQRRLQRLLHHGPLGLVVRAQAGRDAIDHAPIHRGVHDALVEHAAADVGGLLGQFDLLRNRPRRHHPRHAQAGHQHLGEAPQVDHAPVSIVGLDRPRVGGGRGVFEVDRAVRIVLENHQVMAPRGVEQREPPRPAHEQARRVLEVRRHVDELQCLPLCPDAGDGGIERRQVDALGVLRHAGEAGLQVVKRGEGAAVGRELDQDDVARIDQHAPDEVEALLGTGGDDQVFEGAGDAAVLQGLGNQLFDERAIAAGGAVLEHVAVAPGQQLGGDRLEVVPREHLRRGVSRGKRDQAGHRRAENA